MLLFLTDSFTVKYQNSGYAAYAKEKLNGYQYLPKAYITVKERYGANLWENGIVGEICMNVRKKY